MKKKYNISYIGKLRGILFTGLFLFLGHSMSLFSQVIVPFSPRTSVYSPTKTIYNVKGDFTMIGNTNLTLSNYTDEGNNSSLMQYVDIDGISSTHNSSSANLEFSTEHGANPECSNIIFAGLYWTGRAHDGGNSPQTFAVTKGGVTVNFDKRTVQLKGPGAANYTTVTASANDIYFPVSSHGQMYSAYAEVTDYVKQYGVGKYFVANIALREGTGGGTGYYGGWGLIVVYENSKMNWRDVIVFDGHAYVAGSLSAEYAIPITGFNTIQSGAVNMKLGMMAGEGDLSISGDHFEIRNHTNTNWVSLSHSGNTTDNFFNGSIFTGGNPRNPSLTNNTGLDISMFNIPNAQNSVITNNQTSVNFQYGSTQDTYIIMTFAMSVDAYIPNPEAHAVISSINNIPYIPGNPLISEPGDEIEISIDVRNKGTEPIDSAILVIPIPFASSYVSSNRQLFFTPSPSPNNLYFDPTAGANGSIVWKIGTIPLPSDPDDLLGKLTFRIKATENCVLLANTNCGTDIIINGHMEGTGTISHSHFLNSSIVQGFHMSGNCVGEPILTPYIITINSNDYVESHCGSTPTIMEFTYCNIEGSIPITQVSGNFPAGTRFYNQFPVTQSAIEYTISNPFPATAGTKTYYAVPQGSSSCHFEFRIIVTNLNSTPNVSTNPVEYCLNDIASPLTATASNPSLFIYYYDSPSGIPQTSITPSTATVGTYTFYASEGVSGSCISPKKAPIQVIVKPLPAAPLTAVASINTVCYDDNGNITLSATGGSGTTLNWYTGSCQGTLIGQGNNLIIPSPNLSTTYYAAWSNSCGISTCAEVTVNVIPELILTASVTAEISSYNSATGEITVSATGGTGNYTYSINGGTPQASNVFSGLTSGTY
ncbi:MAG: SprB repeat-containing protein, partial [Bacteroidales bacterium]|nr:SprB repeat-containing protein [Bacteroidales bacterium]